MLPVETPSPLRYAGRKDGHFTDTIWNNENYTLSESKDLEATETGKVTQPYSMVHKQVHYK